MPNDTPSAKPLTKTLLKQKLGEATGLSAKQAGDVLDALNNIAVEELNKAGVGQFSIPGVIKITKKIKPATPEKPGINPFTKLPITIKAKPARNVVRVQALKGLKDAIA